MNRLSLRNNRLRFKTSGELPITLEELMEYTSNQYRKTEGSMSTCNRLDLQTLGSQPMIVPKNFPDHWIGVGCKVS